MHKHDGGNRRENEHKKMIKKMSQIKEQEMYFCSAVGSLHRLTPALQSSKQAWTRDG